MPLNTHLIIHWGGTLAGDDPDGSLFAKFRYLLDKRFRRKFGIELTAIWVRERHRNKRTRQQSEVVHSHLLLHLPTRHRDEAGKDVEELVTLVARQILDDRTIELTFPANPDGKYLLKGGTPAVWEEFSLPHKWRSKLGEGLIEGKRCGGTSEHWPGCKTAGVVAFYVARKKGVRWRPALSELAQTELSLFGSSAPVYSRQEASQDQCQDQDTELASN